MCMERNIFKIPKRKNYSVEEQSSVVERGRIFTMMYCSKV